MSLRTSGPVPPATVHASADELALFVIDALEPAARRRFERHLHACVACAEALMQEAAAEQSLLALWPLVERPLAPVLALPMRAAARDLSGPRVQPDTGRQSGPRATPAAAVTRRAVGARSSSWNGLAAAAMTLLFLGYWTDVGRAGRPGAVGLAALDGLLATEAFCAVGGNSDGALCDVAAVSSGLGEGTGSAESSTSATTPSRWACLSPATDDATGGPIDGSRGLTSWAPLCREPVAGFCASPRP